MVRTFTCNVSAFDTFLCMLNPIKCKRPVRSESTLSCTMLRRADSAFLSREGLNSIFFLWYGKCIVCSVGSTREFRNSGKVPYVMSCLRSSVSRKVSIP